MSDDTPTHLPAPATNFGIMPTVHKYGHRYYPSYGSNSSTSYKASTSNDDAAS